MKKKKPITKSQYRKQWSAAGPLEIKMITKCGKCRHKIGDKYYYNHPYDKPGNVCTALLHVLDLYTWRVALGFPSWENDDRNVHRIHCPAKKGTVWELRKVNKRK